MKHRNTLHACLQLNELPVLVHVEEDQAVFACPFPLKTVLGQDCDHPI